MKQPVYVVLFSTLVFALVSVASCGGSKTSPSDSDTASDSIVTDEDLLTDDLIPDEEETDAEPTDKDTADKDTTDKDTADQDTTDKDTADVEPDTEEEPDTDVAENPCVPNPCTAIEHSTGGCVAEGDTFTCICEEHYSWNSADKTCDADTRRTDCVNIPFGAHGIGDNLDGKFEQVWDGDSWEPATFECAWECDENYTKVNETCVADRRRVDCTNIPDNAHGVGINSDGKFEQVWDGDSWEPENVLCLWECDENYSPQGNECIPNSRLFPCSNQLPDNAHWIAPNENGMFTQVWDGDSWEPAVFDCPWECNENYSKNGPVCEANTRRVACTNPTPEHAHYSGANADGQFEQRWNGSEWEPATFVCEWECDEGYVWDENANLCLCAGGTRRVDCTNIPEHAHGTGDNADGKFEQTWDCTSWIPETFACTWECDENYTWNGNECEPGQRRVDCENIPEHAHGIGENFDGKFQQVWNGTRWEPETFECAWECDRGYWLNQSGDGCDFQSVIYVNHSATGANDGTSWEDAFTDLSDALTTAVNGQEIWVAAGVYRPTRCPYGSQCEDREKTFMMFRDTLMHFVVYGGFEGTETSRDQRDWVTNATVLSGDINDDDIWDDLNHIWLNRSDNVYHVLTFDPVFPDNTLLLDGFVIVGGHASDNPNPNDRRGAGLSTTNHSVVVRNCTFSGHTALNGSAIAAYDSELTVEDSFFRYNVGGIISGGGDWILSNVLVEENYADNTIVSFGNGSLTITGSTFLNNYAEEVVSSSFTNAEVTDSDFLANSGRALSFLNNVTLFVGNCVFEDNGWTGGEIGGAIHIGTQSTAEINSSFFTRNTAPVGSAIVSFESDLTITSCEFRENTTTQWDGAVSISGGTSQILSSQFIGNTESVPSALSVKNGATLLLQDTVFEQNISSPKNDETPLTVNISESTATIISTRFSENSGSALSIGDSTTLIEDSKFIANRSVNHGAIFQENMKKPLTIKGCYFKDNAADMPGTGFAGLGGAIMLNGMDGSSEPVTIVNSVFDGNRANLWGGALLILMANPRIVNCTFANNTDSGNDGIVFVASNADFDNTIIWDEVNQIMDAGPYHFPPSNPTFRYSDVRYSGGSGNTCGPTGDEPCWVLPFGTDGGGNIDANPLFVGSGNNPLDLQSGSPCVNTGSNALVPADVTTDILGDPRIQNGTVDMGAYEQ